MAVLLGGVATADPASILPHLSAAGAPTIPKWWGKANSFSTGPGAEPGRGHVLMTLANLSRVNLTRYNPLKFSGEDLAHVVTLANITVTSAECVSPGSSLDANAVYLCELADRRHFLAMAPVDRAYNVPTADGTAYLPNTVNSCVPWSWQAIVYDLAAAAGTGSIALPFAPDGTPDNLIYWGHPSALRALADVLTRIGCALVYDPVTDYFSAVRLGVDGDARLTAIPAQRTWDGYSSEPTRAWYPEKVRVRFLRRPVDGTAGASPYYTVDLDTVPITGQQAGTTVQIDDDLIALGATGTPTNASNLATRAAERAGDWVRKRAYYDRPVLRAWRDFAPTATGLGGYAVRRVTFDDRGGLMQTWADAGPDGALEEWRPQAGWGPWELPPGPGAPSANPCPRGGSGSGSGPQTDPPTDDYGWPDSEYPGDGQDPKAPTPKCIGGYWYVPSYRTQVINVDGRLRTDYYGITVRQEGCCACPDSGSGPAVTCCPAEPGTSVSAVLTGPFLPDCTDVFLSSVDGIVWDGTKWSGEIVGEGGLTGTIELRCNGEEWYAVGVVTQQDGVIVLLEIPLYDLGAILYGAIYIVSQTGCESLVTLQMSNPCPASGSGPDLEPGATVCTCGVCPDGAPYSWLINVDGGTGDFAGDINSEWRPTNNFAIGSPCTWLESGRASGWILNMAADPPFDYVDPEGRDSWWLTFSNSISNVSVTYRADRFCCGPLRFELFRTAGPAGTTPGGTVPSLADVLADQACDCTPPPTVPVCGAPVELPETLYASVTLGDAGVFEVELTHVPGVPPAEKYTGSVVPAGCSAIVVEAIPCYDGNILEPSWQVTVAPGDYSDTNIPTSYSPFLWIGAPSGIGDASLVCAGATGNITVVVES